MEKIELNLPENDSDILEEYKSDTTSLRNICQIQFMVPNVKGSKRVLYVRGWHVQCRVSYELW